MKTPLRLCLLFMFLKEHTQLSMLRLPRLLAALPIACAASLFTLPSTVKRYVVVRSLPRSRLEGQNLKTCFDFQALVEAETSENVRFILGDYAFFFSFPLFLQFRGRTYLRKSRPPAPCKRGMTTISGITSDSLGLHCLFPFPSTCSFILSLLSLTEVPQPVSFQAVSSETRE